MNLSSQEMISKLDAMFLSRYNKRIAELNKNVYLSPRNDKGAFEVPVVTVGPGGGSILKGDVEDKKLSAPAIVSLQIKNMKREMLIYRISIPYDECEIAAKNSAYFNYLFDSIVDKALGNYKVTIGDENKVRFGEYYISCTREDKTVFKQLEDTNLEFRLCSSVASNEEDYT